MLTREELARLTLEVLAMQKRFFKERTNAALVESKAAEKRLRHECERIVEGPTLFDRED